LARKHQYCQASTSSSRNVLFAIKHILNHLRSHSTANHVFVHHWCLTGLHKIDSLPQRPMKWLVPTSEIPFHVRCRRVLPVPTRFDSELLFKMRKYRYERNDYAGRQGQQAFENKGV
jgi:hypothetical protein